MTQEEADKKTRYFSEGVSAETWWWGNWLIKVSRERSECSFYDLDSVKRGVLFLHRQIVEGGKELELIKDGDLKIKFQSPEDARNCVNEIRKALEFVQSQTSNDAWHEVPATIFDNFGGTL